MLISSAVGCLGNSRLLGSSRMWIATTLAVCAALAGSRASGQFETRSSFGMPGNAPYSAVVGDFNRDGNLDLAVVSYLPTGTVSVLLGNGDGTFRMGATYSVAVQPFFAAAASLRSNGILDLVISDSLSDDVYVMLGQGDGTFQPPVPYPTVGEPFSVIVDDVTGDGIVDIIALTEPGGNCDCVEVLPGKGDGSFGDALDTRVPYNVDGLALTSGYFNSDRKRDVAVTGAFGEAEQVDILLGNGEGIFRADGYYSLVISPNSVIAANFRGGTKTDLAVTVDPGVEVLLGNGNGTFEEPVLYPTNPPAWVVSGDFTGDGRLDLAVANALVTGYHAGVSVLKGNGDGTFQPAVFYPVGKQASFVASGDFNNDGKPDILTVDDVSPGVFMLLNTGTVSFSPTTPLAFQKQIVGTTSPAQTVTLTNSGKTPLKISSMKTTGQFGMTSTCRSNMAAEAKCAISVTFSPTSQGLKSGTVTINDSASSKPMVIELSGTGT